MNLNHNIATSFILLICISANPVYPQNIDTSNENIRLGKSSLIDELVICNDGLETLLSV